MQKVLEFLNSPIPFYLLTSLAILLIILGGIWFVSAHAAPFVWNTTPLTPLSDESITGHAVFDIDRDGKGDAVYELNGFFLNKTWGNRGVDYITLDEVTIGINYHVLGNIKEDRITWGGTGGQTTTVKCQVQTWQYSIYDGLQREHQIIYGSSASNPQPNNVGVFTNDANNTAASIRCAAERIFGIAQLPNLNYTSAGGTMTQQPMPTYTTIDDNLYTVYLANHQIDSSGNTEFQHINANGDIVSLSAINLPTSQIRYASTMDLYQDIYKIPLSNITDANQGLEYQQDIIIDASLGLEEKIMLMDLSDINVNYAQTDTKFILENDTGEYLAAQESTTIHLIPYDDITTQFVNRAWGLYRIDFAGSFPTLLMAAAKPSVQAGMSQVNPDLTITAKSYPPHVLYPSGYGITSSATLNRFYMAEFMNDDNAYTALKTNAGTHTPLTIEIKNAFPDTAVRIRDPATYDSSIPNTYVWLVDQLQTDNTITIDMIANQCFYVDIKNIAINNGAWVELGFLCHNGLTYKILPNTSELNYQFWAFPLGANHIYNQTAEELQTQVRSNSPPYQYVTKIFDANDNIVLDTITNASTSVNLQTLNTTNYTKPLRLEILDYDNSNQTVYTANLGFGNYLASIALFINQYLTYEGFNLVMLMPLIFMAMFTRNTIGIGVVLTVVFIMTMVWFGLISLSEWILYGMMVIAVIGLIAYKVRD